MSDRIAGGLSCAIDGAAEVSVMRGLLDRRFALVRPFRLAVREKLLEHREADFAVVQCVAELAAFVNPSRRDPRKRQASELFDLVFATTWAGICKDCHVWLIGDAEFFQHRAP